MDRNDKVKLMYSTPKSDANNQIGMSQKAHIRKISEQIQHEREKRFKVESELRKLMIENEPYNGLWASDQ